MKTNYPPLLAEGFKDIRLDQLKTTFLTPFPTSTTRAIILRRFKHWLKRVKTLSIPCEIWIDGSFATEKVDPRDIDVVLFIDSKYWHKMSSPIKERELSRLANEKLTKEQKKQCLCDSYLGAKDDVFDRREWEKTYGRSHPEKTLKGIFRIFI